MAQNEKPNVDDLFARMFGGTKPVEDNPGGEDKEENPPAQKTAAKPPAKAKKEVQPKPEKPAEPQEVAEPPAQEPAPKAKRGRKPAAKTEIRYFGGSKVNSNGRVHVSYWLDTRLVAAIDQRCARERLLGRTGEKSSVVESALAEYLAEELDKIDDELL